MSFENNIVSGFLQGKDSYKIQYQPEFPLRYDGTFGPYRPITDKVLSIQKDFENLLKTSPGEWPYDPQLGVGLRHYLFEFPGSQKLNTLEPTIRNQIEKYLPQIDLYSVEVKSEAQDNEESLATIVLKYSIIKTTFAEIVAEMLSFQGKLNISAKFHRGIHSSGDVYKHNTLHNDIVVV